MTTKDNRKQMGKEKTNRKISNLNYTKIYKKCECSNHTNESSSSIKLNDKEDKNSHSADISH